MARREASRPDPSRNRLSSGARGDRDRSRLKVEPGSGWGACGLDHEESSRALDVEQQTVEGLGGEEEARSDSADGGYYLSLYKQVCMITLLPSAR